MQKQTVRAYAILIAILAVAGFFVSDGHLFRLMNADMALDWLRVVLAGFLLYVGFGKTDAGLVKGSLLLVGGLYVGMALLGLVDPQLWGLLPNGLTGFDVIFHLVTGVAAIGVASMEHAVHSSAKS